MLNSILPFHLPELWLVQEWGKRGNVSERQAWRRSQWGPISGPGSECRPGHRPGPRPGPENYSVFWLKCTGCRRVFVDIQRSNCLKEHYRSTLPASWEAPSVQALRSCSKDGITEMHSGEICNARGIFNHRISIADRKHDQNYTTIPILSILYNTTQ